MIAFMIVCGWFLIGIVMGGLVAEFAKHYKTVDTQVRKREIVVSILDRTS